jgi:ketosteroid isomerase-like protein
LREGRGAKLLKCHFPRLDSQPEPTAMQTSTNRAKAAVLAIGLALLGGCSGNKPAQSGAGFNPPVDVAAIRQIEEVLASETNMDKLIGYYAADAVVLDIYAPGLFKGRDQILAGFKPQMDAIRSMKHSFPELNIVAHGDFACAAAQIHFDAKLKDGKSISLTVRQLDAFKRIGNEWKIIQQHISLPVDPKTGLAMLDDQTHVRGAITWDNNPLPGPASSPQAAKAAIRTWMDIGGASDSLDMLMGYYGPGDDLLVYDSFASNLRGMADIKLEMPEFVVDSDGLFGVQLDTQHITLKLKDGTTQKLALRQSDCMRKSGDRWYSFLEHLSFAIDPKTNQAIMGF